jgi:hypothetical protein
MMDQRSVMKALCLMLLLRLAIVGINKQSESVPLCELARQSRKTSYENGCLDSHKLHEKTGQLLGHTHSFMHYAEDFYF